MSRVYRATALFKLAVALLVLTVPSIARAHMDAGSLRALIADQSGAIVPGATVTLTNAATGVARDLVSDSEGYVAFAPIQRGNYDLRVELSGFRTREIKAEHPTLEAYVGNRGSNQIVGRPLNAVQWGQNGAVAANRPYPQWQQINMFFTAAQSTYDSLQLKFEKRQSHGLYLLGSYTLANSLEEGGGWAAGGHTIRDNVLSDYSNLDELLRAARGPNTQVARHRLTLTQVWQLPIGRDRAIGGNWSPVLDAVVGGWQVSSVTSIRSGMPVDVTLAGSGTNPARGQPYSFLNRNGGGILPDATGVDPNGKSSTDDLLRWLDPAAYAVQAVNTPGNAEPVSARGPRAWTTDLSLVKRFTLNAFTADLRAEAFNLFNVVNYGNPNGSFGSASFGQITSAGDPRIIQLAVRFGF